MKTLQMTKEQYEAHQRRHGFLKGGEATLIHHITTSNAAPTVQSAGAAMNKTEREFSWILEARKRKGEIDGWAFELVKLRLAYRTWYTPDFVSWRIPSRTSWETITFYEVKGGHIWDDAKVKYKVAREQVKWATFQMWQKRQGQWKQINGR